MSSDTAPVVAVFKKRVRKGVPLSKPTTTSVATDTDELAHDDDDDDDDEVVVSKRTRVAASVGVKAVTNAVTKAPHVDASGGSAVAAGDHDAAVREGELLRDLTFESSRSAAPARAPDSATVFDGDKAERLEAELRRAKIEAEAKAAGPLGDGVYRGVAGFTKFVEDGDKNRPKQARRGPSTGSAYAKVSCVFDYAMPICKDWKTSGTCGYGDNCIYLHDRTDYKNGWELERDYDAALTAGKDPNAGADDDKGEFYIGSDDDDGNGDGADGAACGICKKALVEPVETVCKHRFCGKCAKKRVVKGKMDCATCGTVINGLFTRYQS
jgi:RING finger protein 113A